MTSTRLTVVGHSLVLREPTARELPVLVHGDPELQVVLWRSNLLEGSGEPPSHSPGARTEATSERRNTRDGTP